MRCPFCSAVLGVKRTVLVNGSCKTSEGVCQKCGKRHLIYVTILHEIKEKGTGANGTAAKLRKGTLKVELKNK